MQKCLHTLIRNWTFLSMHHIFSFYIYKQYRNLHCILFQWSSKSFYTHSLFTLNKDIFFDGIITYYLLWALKIQVSLMIVVLSILRVSNIKYLTKPSYRNSSWNQAWLLVYNNNLHQSHKSEAKQQANIPEILSWSCLFSLIQTTIQYGKGTCQKGSYHAAES